jgi:hypothetical protein
MKADVVANGSSFACRSSYVHVARRSPWWSSVQHPDTVGVCSQAGPCASHCGAADVVCRGVSHVLAPRPRCVGPALAVGPRRCLSGRCLRRAAPSLLPPLAARAALQPSLSSLSHAQCLLRGLRDGGVPLTSRGSRHASCLFAVGRPEPTPAGVQQHGRRRRRRQSSTVIKSPR